MKVKVLLSAASPFKRRCPPPARRLQAALVKGSGWVLQLGCVELGPNHSQGVFVNHLDYMDLFHAHPCMKAGTHTQTGQKHAEKCIIALV